MWKHVRDRAVREVSEGRDIVGLELSLEYHPCSTAVLLVWRVIIRWIESRGIL